MRINLIFFLSNFTHGGGGNSITRLCANLDKRIYNITLISVGKNAYRKIISQKNVKFLELKQNRLIFSIFNLYKNVKKILNKNQKNIFVSNIHYNNVVSLLLFRKLKNLKLIIVERTPIEELDINFSFKELIKKKIIKFLVKKSYIYSDLIIANSNGIRKGLNKIISKKVKVIYPPSINKINLKIKKRKKVKYISSISRLSYEKDIICIINALKKLKNLKVVLNIFGDGPEKNKIINQIKNNKLEKNIFLRGHANNPNKILKHSDLYISSSIFEGCGNSIIEAINNSNIILCSNCPGGNSEIILNGKGGVFFKTSNSDDLANKIRLIVNNPKKYFKKTYLAKKALKRFELRNNVEMYNNIFLTI